MGLVWDVEGVDWSIGLDSNEIGFETKHKIKRIAED